MSTKLNERLKKRLQGDNSPDMTTAASSIKAQADEAARVDARHIPLERIYFEKNRLVNEAKIEAYAASFRETETKQPYQPVRVWANPDGRFLMLLGEHRARAQMLNHEKFSDGDPTAYSTIIAMIHEGECPVGHDRELLQAKENLLREDPNPIEIAAMVKGWVDGGFVTNKEEAAKKLHESTDGAFKSGKTILSQAFAIMADERDSDLVEKVKSGEMKLYKAKKIHSERLEQRKAELAAEGEAKEEEARQKIKLLQEELEQSRALVESLKSTPVPDQVVAATTEDVSAGPGDDAEHQAQEEVDVQIQEEEQRQEDLQVEITRLQEDESAQERKRPKPAKKKAEKPARFSLDFDDAIKIIEVLNAVAEDLDTEHINADPETLKRKQWDSIIADRLPEIHSLATGKG